MILAAFKSIKWTSLAALEGGSNRAPECSASLMENLLPERLRRGAKGTRRGRWRARRAGFHSPNLWNKGNDDTVENMSLLLGGSDRVVPRHPVINFPMNQKWKNWLQFPHVYSAEGGEMKEKKEGDALTYGL